MTRQWSGTPLLYIGLQFLILLIRILLSKNVLLINACAESPLIEIKLKKGQTRLGSLVRGVMEKNNGNEFFVGVKMRS